MDATAVIDTHVHVASNDLTRYPHADRPPFETEIYVHPVEDLVGAMPDAGVHHATIVQPFGIYDTDNSYHADAAAAHPQLGGVCGIAATHAGAEQLRYWVTERGMIGGRVSTLAQGADLTADEGFIAVLRAAAALDVPVCVLTSRKHVPNIGGLARRVPEARIILDHAGTPPGLRDAGPAIAALASLVDADNVFMKISTPLLVAGEPGQRVVDFVLDRFGPSRTLWGTNYPVTNLGGYGATVAACRRELSSLGESERRQVMNDTAARLYRLEPMRPNGRG